MEKTRSTVDESFLKKLEKLNEPARITKLKDLIINNVRYLSLEQALIITESYKQSEGAPKIYRRAKALYDSLTGINITIDDSELIVGNRTTGIRDGVVFPEAGIAWLEREIDSLPVREQDKFLVRPEDRADFFNIIVPYWKGRTLEDFIDEGQGKAIKEISPVVKINQKDHAQGHIIPDVAGWLEYGPSGILERIKKASSGNPEKSDFHKAAALSMEGALAFIRRYAALAEVKSAETENRTRAAELRDISGICLRIAEKPPETFREAVQSIWFLFVILQMESNASSFSPGRIDQYLYPYFIRDLEDGKETLQSSLELLESLNLNFNKIVYMRNTEGAKYFAGFPIGFNISIGGQTREGREAVNELTFMFLKSQEHLGLPQPNLTARMFKDSSDSYLDFCSRVIGLGSGMPQIVNDESIIPALARVGIEKEDAADYGLVGCVELSTPGNNLGWSDAAMFNLQKVLELTINDGVCLLTGKRVGGNPGSFSSCGSFDEFLEMYRKTLDYFFERMMEAAAFVDRAHAEVMPSPFLSCVINDCISSGKDVTAGGARYNLSGIQAIQVANLADSLAVLKKLVFEDKAVAKEELVSALRGNWKNFENLRQTVIHKVPKYGNDVEWVDRLGTVWTDYFADRLSLYTNVRGGPYHMGLYTVSAHVPMGRNVGASPDGRFAGSPLADGGVSPMYGRDIAGPTAVLKSVSRLDFSKASNGTLLNMKFLPSFFRKKEDRDKFNQFLRTFIDLNIHHVQFNVVNKNDLIRAKAEPERYRNLTIRVAGYTAYFTELAEDLQNEIIERTEHTV